MVSRETFNKPPYSLLFSRIISGNESKAAKNALDLKDASFQ